MTKLKELESRFREKYHFPDNMTTRGSPSESILIGGLMRALNDKHKLDSISGSRRLLNLAAMLWKACKTEFGDDLLIATAAMECGLFNGCNEPNIELKAAAVLQEVAKILPAISDHELAEIRIGRQRTEVMLQEVDQIVRRRLTMGRSIFEDYSDEEDATPNQSVKRLKLD